LHKEERVESQVSKHRNSGIEIVPDYAEMGGWNLKLTNI
jgi:hypothetical protein